MKRRGAWCRGRRVCETFEPSTVYTLEGNTLVPVATGVSDAHTLESTGDVLWVVGRKSLARFDGHDWERIPVPEVDATPPPDDVGSRCGID
jgi:hypothetical protein